MRADYQDAINEDFNVKNKQGIEINAKSDDRLKENYTCKDQNWQTGKFQGDIYISTPDATHNEIVKHYENPNYKIPENGYPGTSGFFTNEETASKHFISSGEFDSVGLGHSLQQSPYYDNDKMLESAANNTKYYPEYNGHLDCFRVNEEKMHAEYGTTDLYTAMAQCKENTAWGEGGGFQGYNPYINEMINNGSLKYVPGNSRVCSNNECHDYAERKNQAFEEAKAVNAYIENNNIQGKQGERLGYNELSQNNSKAEGDLINRAFSNHSNTDKVADGGGSNAPPPHDTKSDLSDSKTLDKAEKTGSQSDSMASVKSESQTERESNTKESFQMVTHEDIAGKERSPKESFQLVTEANLAKRSELRACKGMNQEVQTPAVSSGMNGSDMKSAGNAMGV